MRHHSETTTLLTVVTTYLSLNPLQYKNPEEANGSQRLREFPDTKQQDLQGLIGWGFGFEVVWCLGGLRVESLVLWGLEFRLGLA